MSAEDLAKIRACLKKIDLVEKRKRERFWPKDPAQKVHLLDLPDHVLVHIIGYCDPAATRPKLLCSSKKLHQLWKEEMEQRLEEELQQQLEEDLCQQGGDHQEGFGTDINANKLQLDSLPSEVLLTLFKYLDIPSLGRVSQVCTRFRSLCSSDTLWLMRARKAFGSNQLDRGVRNRSQSKLSAKERTRLGRAWTKGSFTERIVGLHNTKFMPRLELEDDSLWVSWGKTIWCHPRLAGGGIGQTATKMLRGHSDDVSAFKVKNGIVVSGGWDRGICGWSSKSGEFLFARRYCHQDEVTGVDVTAQGQIIVSGSRDRNISIWALQPNLIPVRIKQVCLRDRIWSVSVDDTLLVVGTAGHGGIPPLHVIDLGGGGRVTMELGKQLKKGAGQLDLAWQTQSTFLACGYDTYTRLWDIRCNTWVRSWEEPFDESVYCLATDNVNTLLTGTARYGRVRCWDTRSSKPLYMMYATPARHGQSSPVYSLGMDAANIYAALDQSLNHFGLVQDPSQQWGYTTTMNMFHNNDNNINNIIYRQVEGEGLHHHHNNQQW